MEVQQGHCVGRAVDPLIADSCHVVQQQGLQDVVITANGANGVISDADGYFTIPALTANTYTLTPLLYGYSFGELFNNSITVGPNFSGMSSFFFFNTNNGNLMVVPSVTT